VHLAAGDHGLVGLEMAGTATDFRERLGRRLGGAVLPSGPGMPDAWQATLETATRQLDEYLQGQRTRFDVPVDLGGLSPWDRRVLDAVRLLPYGEVTTYAGLARAIGRPGAARAVGGSLGRNPVPVVIPCHRIVASDGTLGGYGGRGNGARAQLLAVKRSLLALEGARVPD
jgi:methylated-DNA-[protein]-cysteine S-methyltransferase